jgi:hypothetical protein
MVTLGELLDQGLKKTGEIRSLGELATATQKTASLLGALRTAAARQQAAVPKAVLDAMAALHNWSIELHSQAVSR